MLKILEQRSVAVRKLEQLYRLVRESHANPITGTQQPYVRVPAPDLGITFLGHSSFLVQMAGRNLLIDPVFTDRLILLRRQRLVGVAPADLPPIDAVLLTHAHMDHLNRPSLRRIVRAARRANRKAPEVIVPHGVEDLVAGIGFSQVYVMRWWETVTLVAPTGLPLRVTMTPAKHWGARMFTDTHREFGGYAVSDGQRTVYHSGDTAYFDGFAEIRERLHPDVALLPIGAYFPDSYRAVHTSPEEALRGFLETGARWMIPMHFGTFQLGREPMHEPPLRLVAEAIRLNVEERVRLLGEGDTLRLSPSGAL